MNLLREYIREFLVEWMPANEKNLMLDQEGMEKSDRENVTKYLKSLGLLESATMSIIPGNEHVFPVIPYPPPNTPEGIEDLQMVIIQYNNRVIPDELQESADTDMEGLFERYLERKGVTYNTVYYSKLKQDLIPLITEMKNFYGRHRPTETAATTGIDFRGDKLDTAHTPSYPSGHTIQAYVIAELLSDQFPDYHEDLIGIAEVVAQSRIDRGVHFPTDIHFGRIIAAIISDRLKNGFA